MSLLVHLLLFLGLAVPIVVLSAFYSEPRDGPALRSVPLKYVRFVVACGAVALVMLLLERIFVSF